MKLVKYSFFSYGRFLGDPLVFVRFCEVPLWEEARHFLILVLQEDGIRIEYCIQQCYGFRTALVWAALEYIYLLLLQVAAFVLAILIWKVEIKVLNDSKEMMIIVYTSTTIMVILGIFTFALSTRFILQEIFFCGLVMLATVVFLSFLFIPKVRYSVLRYFEHGEEVYRASNLQYFSENLAYYAPIMLILTPKL